MSYPQRYDRGVPAQYGAMQLPIGWQMAYSSEGDIYYIDHNTRTTHWQIPPEVLQTVNQNPGFRVGRVRRGIDRSKLKTKMCMNIQNGGKCTWGEHCAFAHSSEELSAVPHGGNQRGNDGNPYHTKSTSGNNNRVHSNMNNNVNNNNANNNNNNGVPNYRDIQQQSQMMGGQQGTMPPPPQ